MARARGRIRRDAVAWQAVIDRQARSGVSRKTFCEREGIPRSSFETWRRRLASRAVAGEFVEVPASVASVGSWDIELELPGGVVLRMRG